MQSPGVSQKKKPIFLSGLVFVSNCTPWKLDILFFKPVSVLVSRVPLLYFKLTKSNKSTNTGKNQCRQHVPHKEGRQYFITCTLEYDWSVEIRKERSSGKRTRSFSGCIVLWTTWWSQRCCCWESSTGSHENLTHGPQNQSLNHKKHICDI